MLDKEALLEIMRELGKTGVKELIVTHDRVEMRTYERGGAEGAGGVIPRPAPVSAPVDPEPDMPAKPKAEPRPATEPVNNGVDIKAPLPGTVYVAPGHDNNGKPLPGEGVAVEEGTIIALVEAMKMFNEVFSPVKGTIRSLKVRNETGVKVGDLMMVIEKSA
jgi:acetyl-CoA carboxylase biotin carboxyl carrier protein